MVDAVSIVVDIFKTLHAQLKRAKETDEALSELSAHAEKIVGILEQGRGRIVDTNAVADLQSAGRELQEFLGKYMESKQGGVKGAVQAFKNFYRAGRNKETIDGISRRIDEALKRLNLWTNVSMSAKVCNLGGDIERLMKKQDDESDAAQRRHEELQAMLRALHENVVQGSPGAPRGENLRLNDVFEWDPIPLKEWVEKHHGDEDDDEKERSLLATGAFARTYRMKGRLHGTRGGVRVAVKDIVIHEVKSRLKWSVEQVDSMVKTEVEALKRLTHRHIVALVGQFSEGEKKERHEHIVMELASGGTLADLVKEPPVDPERAVVLLHQLAKALTYIHDQGVMHRDIKANNVLLDANGTVKLADFGLSTLGSGTASLISARDDPVGHENYRSPEMHEIGGAYAAPNDLWAFGCLVLEVVTGKLIDQQIYQRENRRREELLQEVSNRHAFLGQLARKILVLDPSKRPTAFQVLQELDEYRKKRRLEAEKLATVTENVSQLDMDKVKKLKASAKANMEKCLYVEALELYHECLAYELETLGHDHVDVAKTYNNMGVVHESLGDYAKALECYQKSLEIKLMALGHDHVGVAKTYKNMGIVHEKLGNYAKALECHQKSLEIKIKALGHDHVDVAKTEENVAFIYEQQGQYEKALEIYKKVLETKRRVFGHDHVDVAKTEETMADVYMAQGQFEMAFEIYKKVATSYNNMAIVLRKLGEYTKALEYDNKALQIEDILAHDHV